MLQSSLILRIIKGKHPAQNTDHLLITDRSYQTPDIAVIKAILAKFIHASHHNDRKLLILGKNHLQLLHLDQTELIQKNEHDIRLINRNHFADKFLIRRAKLYLKKRQHSLIHVFDNVIHVCNK